MPRISSFYGIVIWMYFDEPQHEGRPHFHATYGDDEASFDIDDLKLIAGGSSPRREAGDRMAKELGVPERELPSIDPRSDGRR